MVRTMATAVAVRTALSQITKDLESVGAPIDSVVTVREFVDPLLPPTIDVPQDKLGKKLSAGKRTALRDKRGKRLHVGDEVHVVNSCRYGDPDGVVVGASDRSDTRVLVRLSGDFDGVAYEPSLYRVRRTTKAASSAKTDGPVAF